MKRELTFRPLFRTSYKKYFLFAPVDVLEMSSEDVTSS